MKAYETFGTRKNLYKNYTLEHIVTVYVSYDEQNNWTDDEFKANIFNAVNSLYKLSDYDEYSVGRRERTVFGVKYHIHLLNKIK